MTYPVGPLLRALAQRMLANLDVIDGRAADIRDSDRDVPAYSDTQLLVSLLGVLVFPHERAPGALGRLLRDYDGLSRVVAVRYSAAGVNRVEITGPDGEPETVDPTSIRDLPRILRNSIAHFNVRPIERNGSFAGIRVWSEDKSSRAITLVADLDFAQLRPLARHILIELATSKSGLTLDDPPDPLDRLARADCRTVPAPRRPPKIIEDVWSRILSEHNGDYDRAKGFVDRVLERASRDLKTAGR